MRKCAIALALAAAGGAAAWQSGLFPTLISTARAGRQPDGFYLLPTNQLLRPWGETTLLAGRPVDMAFDPEKRILAVLNMRGINVLDAASGAELARIPSRSTSYAGIAFRPGSRELWASETSRTAGSLLVAEISQSGKPGKVDHIELKNHPVPVGIAFSSDGKRAYVAFSRSNSVAVINASSREIEREIAVGSAPFGLALCEKYGRLFVSNRGGSRPTAGDATAPSSGAMMAIDPVTGSTRTGTVSVVDLKTFAVAEIPVGLAPSALALSPDGSLVAAANGHSDTVSIIDASSLRTTTLPIPAWPDNTLGSQPVAAAFSEDGSRLYVGCGGVNAIAVAARSRRGWNITGAIPTGWFPSAIAIDSSGFLRVLNIKGVGATANQRGTFNSRQYEGSLIRVPQPGAPQLVAGAREVRAANEPKFDSAGGIADLTALGIRHVVLIIKENRTYDQVFGDIAKGNGDPRLVMYGRAITPNHHALAERYVLLDNFYTGGAVSFDGHHWLMQAFVSDYVERAFAASPRGYAWNMSDALVVAPTGFFWQGAPKQPTVRLYGETCIPAKWDPATQSAIDMSEHTGMTWSDYWRLYKEGRWQTEVGCQAGVPALKPLLDPRYPFGSTQIPDQLRADEFLRDLADHERAGSMPNISVVDLNSDHTSGTRPGSPTPRAMVADNDLALGRIVEALSKSRFWPHMLILAVEDDAQDGVDHVDGRRTVALAIGPRVRRNAVDSNFYDHTSMIRTIQDIFGIPPRTRFARSARAMNSVFTAQADLTPYKALTPEQPLDEMNPPLKALSGRQLWAAKQSLAMNFRDIDDAPQEILNRILWWDAKGYDKPFPARR